MAPTAPNRRALHLAPFALVSACVGGVVVGDSPQETAAGSGDSGRTTQTDSVGETTPAATGAESGGTGTTGTASLGDTTALTTSPTSGDEGTTEDPPAECVGNPLFTCAPQSCREVECDNYLSGWDEHGCLRIACEAGPEPCPRAMTCLRPFEWGGCTSSDPTRGMEVNGTCQFDGATLPDCGGGFCIPSVNAPPANCAELEGQGPCEAAGCTFMMVQPIAGENEGSFACAAPEPVCLWFPEGQGGDDALTPHGLVGGSTPSFPTRFAVFPADYDVPPLGWRRCDPRTDETGVCRWWNEVGCQE